MISRLFKSIRDALTQSNRVHLRQNPAGSTDDLIPLIDRFLDGPMQYPLEWDDFISWKNENAHVEEIRIRIGQFEPLLFSKAERDRALYRTKLIEERNRLARLLGLTTRDDPQR